MKVLLFAGAAKDKADTYGQTALRWASLNGHVECVKPLLAAGAKKDMITINGKTALTWVTQRGQHEIVQLLQQGA